MAHKSKPEMHRLGFEDFRQRAGDSSLSKYEKSGFPNEYRHGKESAIFADILFKLPALNSQNGVFVDIGCGCTDLPKLLSDHCVKQNHKLILIDSAEMLSLAPTGPNIEHYPGEFPSVPGLEKLSGQVDGVIVYSVIQYPFAKNKAFEFIDATLKLLKHTGALLIGDIPNRSSRARYFKSPAGIGQHKQLTGSTEPMSISPPEKWEITDRFIVDLLKSYRDQGYDVFVLQQNYELPFAKHREDVLIIKP